MSAFSRIATGIDFIVAKVRAMHSRAYEGDRLEAILTQRTLPELAHQLFPNEVFPGHIALERRLVERFADDIAMLWRFLGPPRDRFFLSPALRLQVENLKVVLRSYVHGHLAGPAALPRITLPEPFQWPDIDPARVSSLHDIVTAIPEPTVRHATGEALILYAETPVPLYLEAGIDRGYFTFLSNSFAALGRDDRKAITPLVQLEVDIHNLMFVLRARVNHDVAPKIIRKLAAPQPNGDAAGWLGRASEGESARDIIAQAPVSLQRALGEVPAELPAIERRLWRRYYALANRTYYPSFQDVGCLYAFIAIKRIELANLITAVEALRYGLTPEQTQERFLKPLA